jgi:hypothetical protein
MEVGGIKVWWHAQCLHTYAELVALGSLPDCEPHPQPSGMQMLVSHEYWPHDQSRSTVTRPMYIGQTQITTAWEWVDKDRAGKGSTWTGLVVGTKGGDNTVAIVDYSTTDGRHLGLYFFPPFAQVRLTAVKTVGPDRSQCNSPGRSSLPAPLFLAAAPPSQPIEVRLKVRSHLGRYFFPIGARVVVRWHKAKQQDKELSWQGVVEATPDNANAVLLRLADGKTQRLPPTNKAVFIDGVTCDSA